MLFVAVFLRVTLRQSVTACLRQLTRLDNFIMARITLIRHGKTEISAFGKRAHESEIRKDLIQCIAGHAALDRKSSLNNRAMNLLIAQMEQLDLPPLNSSGERLWFLIPKDELIKRLKA